MAACGTSLLLSRLANELPHFPSPAISAKWLYLARKPARCDNGVLSRGPALTCHGRRRDRAKGAAYERGPTTAGVGQLPGHGR